MQIQFSTCLKFIPNRKLPASNKGKTQLNAQLISITKRHVSYIMQRGEKAILNTTIDKRKKDHRFHM